MTELPAADRFGNPFSTRHVRPGAIEYLFTAGEGPAQIIDRLAASAWHGQIVGPHGSGKSALLAALQPELLARGRRPRWLALHDGQRALPANWARAPLEPADQLIVDGFEQLSCWSRWRLRRVCSSHGCGLLITLHRARALPTVAITAATLALAEQLVARLVPANGVIHGDDIADSFACRQGNLRELLFDMYDLYERRRQPPPACDASSDVL